jgi:DNA-binding NarL/FixJ family response regulator
LGPIRVIVVEDFEQMRRWVCSTLTSLQQLQIICEVTDGQDAVVKAEELQPDLIVMDIGLPTLNGIEAARQIRTLSPQSKILFLTQESSPEVVQEALSLGASGYVVKVDAARELSDAVEAVLQGKQFASAGIARRSSTKARDTLAQPLPRPITGTHNP